MSYLKTIYFKDETGEYDYPQLLCNHLYKTYLADYSTSSEEPLKFLDVGSGKGNHLIGFQRCGLEVYGMDLRQECVDAVPGVDIRICDIENENFPFESDTFDFVFSKSVIEHVSNTDRFAAQVHRVLKPGGRALLLTPDWRSQMAYFWDDYTHVQPFTRKSLQNLLKIYNFDNAKCEFLLQLPFVWRYPALSFVPWLISFLPDVLRWKDRDESKPNTLIRFSKEKMLVGYGEKRKEG